MSERITPEQRQAMLIAWLEIRNIDGVAKQCDVAWQTVKRYHELDQWDKAAERLDKRRTKQAIDTVDARRERARKRREKNCAFAQSLICKMASGLADKGNVVPLSATDLNTLARLIEFLSGEADSTTEHRFRTAKDVERFIESLDDNQAQRLEDALDAEED